MPGWWGGGPLSSQPGISSQRHLSDMPAVASSPGGSRHPTLSFGFAQTASCWARPAHTAHVTEPATGVASDSPTQTHCPSWLRPRSSYQTDPPLRDPGGVLASYRSDGESRLHHSLAVCPWANYLTSLALCFFIYKMGMMHSTYFVGLL